LLIFVLEELAVAPHAQQGQRRYWAQAVVRHSTAQPRGTHAGPVPGAVAAVGLQPRDRDFLPMNWFRLIPADTPSVSNST
jgi:hypothetical protein